jgi:two-component system NtrC family sensor kinase
MTAGELPQDLAAEVITIRLRWIGVVVGFALVNLGSEPGPHVVAMNGLLTLGAVYALVETLRNWQGRVLLGRFPWVVSAMESLFIGLLCWCDNGVHSPFRFYYFLSLLVVALRHPSTRTWGTFGLHLVSYAVLGGSGTRQHGLELETFALTVVFLGWFTWSVTGLAALFQSTRRDLVEANEQLRREQTQLETRIVERTGQLQESQALIVQGEKQAAFGLLAAGIAHEVGNPLAAISSLVQLLQRKPHDEYTRERLQMVDDQLRRIQRTLAELTDFSRPASDMPSTFPPHEALDAALNIAKYYKRMQRKSVVTRYSAGLPSVTLPRDLLVQVVLNLILNAMDATAEGGTIELGLEVSPVGLTGRASEARPMEIRVLVTDNGCGIAKDDQPRVFDPYFTTKPTGTGLGLFVCRQIVEQRLGGRIELLSSSPNGTAFCIDLPRGAGAGAGS